MRTEHFYLALMQNVSDQCIIFVSFSRNVSSHILENLSVRISRVLIVFDDDKTVGKVIHRCNILSSENRIVSPCE